MVHSSKRSSDAGQGHLPSSRPLCKSKHPGSMEYVVLGLFDDVQELIYGVPKRLVEKWALRADNSVSSV